MINTANIQGDFYIAGLQIHLYSVLFGLAILVGYLTARIFAKKWKLDLDIFDNLMLVGILSGFLGARIFFIIGEWSYYGTHLVEIIYFWRGGVSLSRLWVNFFLEYKHMPSEFE